MSVRRPVSPVRSQLLNARRAGDDAADDDDVLTHLLVSLESATDLFGLCATLQTLLPKLVPHDWAIFVPLVGEAEAWHWQTATPPLRSLPIPALPIDALAQYRQPLYGSSLSAAPREVQTLVQPLADLAGRYALLPLRHGPELAVLCLGTVGSARWSKLERQQLARCAAGLGLALRQVALTAQLVQVERNAQLLDSIRTTIAHTLHLPDLLRQVVELVAQCYGYSLVSLYLLEDDELRCQHHVGYDQVIWTIPVAAGIMGRAVRQRQPILVEDVAAEPEFIAAVPHLVSEIAIPLQSGGTIYGVLNIESLCNQRLGRRDLELLQAVGADVSVAIECAMLYTATHRQAQQLAVIERLRTAIASQLDTEALAATIVRSLHTVLHFDCVSLFVLHQGLLRLRAYIGASPSPYAALTLEQGLTGLCVRKLQPLLVSDVRQEPAYIGADEQIRSGAYLPLIYGETVLGALSLEAYTPLTASDFAVVTALSEQIAAALEQSRRVERARTAQVREAFLNDLLTALNQAPPDTWLEVWPRLAEQLGRLLSVEHCSISLFGADQVGRIVSWSMRGPEAIAGVVQQLPLAALNQKLLARFRRGQILAVSDIRAERKHMAAFREVLLAEGVRALAIVPVLVDGALVAAIGVFRDQPWIWAREDLELLERVAQHLAVVLRQTELRAQEAQRRHELELVHQIALAINAHHDLQSVLQVIVERACELLLADTGVIYLLRPEEDMAELRVGVNIPLELIGSRMRRDHGLFGKTVQTSHSYLIPNYSAWPERDAAFGYAAFGAVLGVPLIANRRVIGMLGVGHIGQTRQFRPTDQRLIELIAAQAAQAIETAQLLEDVRRRTVEIEAVYANALALTAQQEPTQVLQSIVERAMALMGASAVGLHLLDHATHELELAVGLNVPRQLLGTRVKLGEGVAGQVAQTRQSLLIHDYQRYVEQTGSYAALQGESMLCVPLLSGEQVLGAIGIVHAEAQKRFTLRDQQMLELFASQAAQAIEHARRFERERMLRADAEGSLAEMQAVLQELEQTNERIGRIEKFRLLGELASEVAHDFNNALVSILGNTQFLLLDENDPERISMLRAVEAAARDSVTMVKRIQEFGRSQHPSQTETVNLNTIVRDAVIMTQSRWREVVEPTTSLLATAPVHGSATELRRVLMNLIVNAIDAMPSGGSLHLATRDVSGMVRITVTDTGSGMPPHIQARIFDPFFTTKALGMGTGLGLSICQQIITRYGGTIEVLSKPNHGTTFTISLPAAAASAHVQAKGER